MPTFQSLLILGYLFLYLYLSDIYSLGNMIFYHLVYIIFLIIYLMYLKQPQQYTNFLKQPIVSQQYLKLLINTKKCIICNKYKPPRFYHCRRCNICIYKMDHHCDWLNTCVGEYNMRPFLHLIGNLLVNSGYTVGIIGWDIKKIVMNQDRKIYLLLFLLLPSLFLGYEVQRLIKDVWIMWKSNQTLVESYKKVYGKRQKKIKTIEQFMGCRKLLWLIPVYLYQQNARELTCLLEETTAFCKENIEELTYADQYIYGKDQDYQQFEKIQKQLEKNSNNKNN